MCALLTNAQDSTTYKVKIEKYKALERTGNVFLISGAALAVIGGGLILKNIYVNDEWITVGFVSICAGVVACIPGIIDKSVGKRKTKEYKIRLNDLKTSFYYTPKYSGFRLTYRF